MKKTYFVSKKKKEWKYTIFELYMILILLIPVTTLLQNTLDAINRILFIAIFILQTIIIAKNMHKPYMILFLWTILVFISIPFASSWYIKEGGRHYFGSFTGTIFRLGSTALFIQIWGFLVSDY